MRVLPHRAMPPRGSFQDRVVQEMLLRERRRSVVTSVYHARLIAAGLGVRSDLFDLWTMLYVDEVTHENYQPDVVKQKRGMLDAFTTRRRVDQQLVQRAESYTVKSSKDLLPYSKEQIEAIKTKMRKKALEDATKQ
jgi:hypothetical protein